MATPRKVVDVKLRRARGDHEAVELLLLDVALHVSLAGVGAGEHHLAGDDHAGFAFGGGDDLVDIDVVGDVAAAVADVDADPALLLGHAGTFAFSR